MPDTFLTIAAPTESIYKEKESRFIGLAFQVSSEEQVKAKLQELKQTYWDARHHCYAFMLGPGRQHYRASDAGEPAHSAGTPILGQIRSRGLTDVLVVVIRYFGGTKLGVPGLITAYKAAAADALDQAQVLEKVLTVRYKVSFPYEIMSQAMRLLKDVDGTIEHSEYGSACYLEVSIPKKNATVFSIDCEKIHNLGVELLCI